MYRLDVLSQKRYDKVDIHLACKNSDLLLWRINIKFIKSASVEFRSRYSIGIAKRSDFLGLILLNNLSCIYGHFGQLICRYEQNKIKEYEMLRSFKI